MTFLDRFRAWLSGLPPGPSARAQAAKPRVEPAAWIPGSDRLDRFDPALRHYRRGVRNGDPALPPALLDAWRAVHAEALHEVAMAITMSPAAGNLVLRGGYALRLWFGADARRPRDLDFVVIPQDWAAGGAAALSLLDTVSRAVQRVVSTEFTFVPDAVAVDDIWTYERVEGRRLTFHYHPSRPDLWAHWGQVQVDVVFGEPLGDPVTRTVLHPGTEAALNVASRRESLAWKLYWLWSDGHWQGKDLYDATLLAERAEPGSLVGLTGLLALADSAGQHPLLKGPLILPRLLADLGRPDGPGEWSLFERDYPSLAAPGPAAMRARLLAALQPGTAG